MFATKKILIKEEKGKYLKKNYILPSKKNKYNKTSLSLLTSLPNLSQNNFTNIFNEYNPQFNNDISTEKIEILEDGSVCRKNTKNTTRLNSPQNDNFNTDINNEDYIYNTGLKYNKSVPNIRTLTYTKDKENFVNEVYIPHKPYDNSGKTKINFRPKKENDIKNNKELNYKRVLFNNQEDDYENDIINIWKYLSKKYIMYYNNKLLNMEIQIIIQNLKINQILKKKEKLPTNLINIINPQQQNLNEVNQNFFDEVEKKFKKEDKIIKYKADIESINEEMNESIEDQEEKKSMKSIKSNKIKENKLKPIKNINELKIKDIESISFVPMSAKNKDIKFIFNKNKEENKQNKDMHFIYKKENIIKKGMKFKFNETKNNTKIKINNNINNIILKLTKEKYESLILSMINNFIYYNNRNKNNINNNEENVNDNLNKKIKEFEESIKELKNIYIYGIKNAQIISNEKDKINFIKKLDLTKKRNSVKKIYKEIVAVLNNSNKENNINYLHRIIDMLKIHQKINEKELKIDKNNKRFVINNIIIKILLFLLPIIFAFKYYNNNFRKI